ncbi:MAG: hypothetical protein CVV49_15020 [Spirochaetae bacterium HGW-Spirochaetae-5]|nr:MAG: hypothetical protein CVV49_15020 [Spirochaetae bacterium HGW-Spirochaetae-5]
MNKFYAHASAVNYFPGAYAPHTPEMGDYGGAVPVIPHFSRSAKRCAPKNKRLPTLPSAAWIIELFFL